MEPNRPRNWRAVALGAGLVMAIAGAGAWNGAAAQPPASRAQASPTSLILPHVDRELMEKVRRVEWLRPEDGRQ